MTKQAKQRERETTNWFCKKHGLRGTVGKDWCFGCYRLDEDTEQPVPHIGYGIVEPEYKQQIRRAIELLSDIHDAHNQALSQQREEVRREVVEEMKKTLDFGDLYVFDRELPRVEGIDEQGIRYKGMQVNIDKLDLSAREEKGVK